MDELLDQQQKNIQLGMAKAQQDAMRAVCPHPRPNRAKACPECGVKDVSHPSLPLKRSHGKGCGHVWFCRPIGQTPGMEEDYCVCLVCHNGWRLPRDVQNMDQEIRESYQRHKRDSCAQMAQKHESRVAEAISEQFAAKEGPVGQGNRFDGTYSLYTLFLSLLSSLPASRPR